VDTLTSYAEFLAAYKGDQTAAGEYVNTK
jgi:hypothetical protein